MEKLEEQRAQLDKSQAKAARVGRKKRLAAVRDNDMEGGPQGRQQHGDPKPSASSSDRSHVYIKFTKFGALPPDLSALVVVAAAYATVSPRHMFNALVSLEGYLVRADKAYVGKRMELHSATGLSLIHILPFRLI